MKKLLMVLFGLLIASASQAVVLAWQLNLGTANTDYAYAVLYAVGSPDAGLAGTAVSAGKTTSELKTDIGSSYTSSQQFYIGLLNSSGTLLAKSDPSTYSALATAGSLGADTAFQPLTSTWTITTVTPVPEPTSVLLVCLGFAAVALRRRIALV